MLHLLSLSNLPGGMKHFAFLRTSITLPPLINFFSLVSGWHPRLSMDANNNNDDDNNNSNNNNVRATSNHAMDSANNHTFDTSKGGINAQWFRSAKNRDVSIGPLACPFARTAHSFARSAQLAFLARSAALICSLPRSLRSLPSSWESM